MGGGENVLEIDVKQLINSMIMEEKGRKLEKTEEENSILKREIDALKKTLVEKEEKLEKLQEVNSMLEGKIYKLMTILENKAEATSVKVNELERKYNETVSSNKNLMDQNDKLRQTHNEEMQMMQQNSKDQWERIYHVHEKLRSEMESQMKELELGKLEAHNKSKNWKRKMGPNPPLVKAEVSWSVRRRNLSEKDRVLKTVQDILNKQTSEKFDLLKRQLTTPDILKGVVSLIFEKAVLAEPTFLPMYALLCSDLNEELPPFPSDERGGKEITFKRILLNNCQEAFEGAENLRNEIRQMTATDQELERRDKERMVKLRTHGNIRLIGGTSEEENGA